MFEIDPHPEARATTQSLLAGSKPWTVQRMPRRTPGRDGLIQPSHLPIKASWTDASDGPRYSKHEIKIGAGCRKGYRICPN